MALSAEEAQYWHTHRDGTAHGHAHSGYHTHAGSSEPADRPLTSSEAEYWHSHTGRSGERYQHGHKHNGRHAHAGIDEPAAPAPSAPAPSAPAPSAPAASDPFGDREWTWNPAAGGDPNANLMVLADGSVINVNDPAQRAAYAERNRRAIEATNAEMDAFAPGSRPSGAGGDEEDPYARARAEEERRRKEDAFYYIVGLLNDYGLGGVASVVWSWIEQGWSTNRILQEMRNPSNEVGKAFHARFPAIQKLMSAGKAPITPAEYIAYEQGVRNLFQQYGIPSTFFDEASDFTEFIAREIKIADLQKRVQNGFLSVALAPSEVRDVFREYFGVQGDNALAMFFLDPDRAIPVLERQVQQALIGGTGKRYGFNLMQSMADRLAGIGVNEQTAASGFAAILGMKPIFSETISETEDYTAENEGFGAAFGLDPNAAEKIRKRVESRVSAFRGGGAAAQTDRGIVGLGVAE